MLASLLELNDRGNDTEDSTDSQRAVEDRRIHLVKYRERDKVARADHAAKRCDEYVEQLEEEHEDYTARKSADTANDVEEDLVLKKSNIGKVESKEARDENTGVEADGGTAEEEGYLVKCVNENPAEYSAYDTDDSGEVDPLNRGELVEEEGRKEDIAERAASYGTGNRKLKTEYTVAVNSDKHECKRDRKHHWEGAEHLRIKLADLRKKLLIVYE